MKVFVVLARSAEHCYVFGVYADRGMAWKAALTFRGNWTADVEEKEFIGYKEPANSDDIDLQQQLEALQAYVDVLQNYVLTLKDAMMILLDMPDIRKAMGEKVTQRLRKDLAEGRRSTFDDEMRKYIRER